MEDSEWGRLARVGVGEKLEGGEWGSQMPRLQLACWGFAQIMLFLSTH